MTLEQHLSLVRPQIEAEAAEYACVYNMSLERARREVEGEYRQGWYEEQDDISFD